MKFRNQSIRFGNRPLLRAPTMPLFEENKEGGGGGGGGAPPAEKMLPQSEVDRIIGQRVGEVSKRFADYDQLKEKVGKLSEIETELTKLREEKETANLSAAEKERVLAERAARQLERERTEAGTKLTAAEKRAEAAEQKYRDMIVANALGTALDAAKVLPSARDKAVKLLRSEAEVELDDNGKIVSVTFDGVAFKSPAEAATAFLKSNDFLAAAGSATGGRSSAPNASGANGRDVFKASAEENFAEGLSRPARSLFNVDG